jgi:hypothetical protein
MNNQNISDEIEIKSSINKSDIVEVEIISNNENNGKNNDVELISTELISIDKTNFENENIIDHNNIWTNLKLNDNTNKKTLIVIIDTNSILSKDLYHKNIYHIKYIIEDNVQNINDRIKKLEEIMLFITSGLYRFINKVIISSNINLIRELMLITPNVIINNRDSDELFTSFFLISKEYSNSTYIDNIQQIKNNIFSDSDESSIDTSKMSYTESLNESDMGYIHHSMESDSNSKDHTFNTNPVLQLKARPFDLINDMINLIDLVHGSNYTYNFEKIDKVFHLHNSHITRSMEFTKAINILNNIDHITDTFLKNIRQINDPYSLYCLRVCTDIDDLIDDMMIEDIGFNTKREISRLHRIKYDNVKINIIYYCSDLERSRTIKTKNEIINKIISDIKEINPVKFNCIVDSVKIIDLNDIEFSAEDDVIIKSLMNNIKNMDLEINSTYDVLKYYYLLDKYQESLNYHTLDTDIFITVNVSGTRKDKLKNFNKLLVNIDIKQVINLIMIDKLFEVIYISDDIFAIGTKKIMLYAMLLFKFIGSYKPWKNIRQFPTNGICNSKTYYKLSRKTYMSTIIQFTEHIMHFSDIILTKINPLKSLLDNGLDLHNSRYKIIIIENETKNSNVPDQFIKGLISKDYDVHLITKQTKYSDLRLLFDLPDLFVIEDEDTLVKDVLSEKSIKYLRSVKTIIYWSVTPIELEDQLYKDHPANILVNVLDSLNSENVLDCSESCETVEISEINESNKYAINQFKTYIGLYNKNILKCIENNKLNKAYIFGSGNETISHPLIEHSIFYDRNDLINSSPDLNIPNNSDKSGILILLSIDMWKSLSKKHISEFILRTYNLLKINKQSIGTEITFIIESSKKYMKEIHNVIKYLNEPQFRKRIKVISKDIENIIRTKHVLITESDYYGLIALANKTLLIRQKEKEKVNIFTQNKTYIRLDNDRYNKSINAIKSRIKTNKFYTDELYSSILSNGIDIARNYGWNDLAFKVAKNI